MTPTTATRTDLRVRAKTKPLPTTQPASSLDNGLFEEFCSLRQQSVEVCAPLTAEDMMVQSCPEASPAKWHLAHTTWFYETFILREFLPEYCEFHPDFLWLLNSYYNSVSDHPEKKLRASFSRPASSQFSNTGNMSRRRWSDSSRRVYRPMPGSGWYWV